MRGSGGTVDERALSGGLIKRARRGGGRRQGPVTWYTSDWHLGHARIIELCERPFTVGGEPDVAAMNEAVLDGINRKVMPRDRLVVLGDSVMGEFAETVKLLRRIKAERVLLLPGNHDRFSLAYRHPGGRAAEVQAGKRKIWAAQYEAVRRGVRAVEDRAPSAWDMRLMRGTGAYGKGVLVTISHYPYQGESQEGRSDRYASLRPVDRGGALVHGHVHTRWRVQERMFNVGVDVNGFEPVSEDELAAWALMEKPLGGDETALAAGAEVERLNR